MIDIGSNRQYAPDLEPGYTVIKKEASRKRKRTMNEAKEERTTNEMSSEWSERTTDRGVVNDFQKQRTRD
jgi:hypothetical protein